MSALLSFLKLLPDIIALMKIVVALFEKGITAIEIKSKLGELDDAQANPDLRQSAEEMDNVFRD